MLKNKRSVNDKVEKGKRKKYITKMKKAKQKRRKLQRENNSDEFNKKQKASLNYREN